MSCFVCLSRVGRNRPNSNLEEDAISGHDLYKNLIQFATNHLKIPTVGIGNQRDDGDRERKVFCNECEKVVVHVCQLYLELRQVQLRLSSKLGELGELFQSAGGGDTRVIKRLADDLGIGDVGDLQDLRDWLRLKCKQKGSESFPDVETALPSHEIKKEIIDSAGSDQEDEGNDWVDSDGDDNDDEIDGENDSDPDYSCPEYQRTRGERPATTNLKRKREVEELAEDDELESGGFQCCFCWMSFENLSNLETHVGRNHARGNAKETFQMGAFKCEEDGCEQRFQNHNQLNSHLSTHSKEVHFCPVCQWGFIDANLLKLHELAHIKPFRDDGKIAFHWRTCPEPDCNLACDTTTKLQRHYNMKHGAQLKRFKCSECGHTATSEKALAAHERVAHLGQRRKDRPTPIPKQSPSTNSSLIPCEVEECPEQFSSHLELNSHLQTHSETINFCQECGFGFIDINLLKLHELVHIKPSVKRGEKKMRLCPEPGCSFGSHTIAGLQRHYNIKHGVSLKRFKCSECDHCSTSEGALRTHIKFMHGTTKRVAYNQKDGQKKCVDCGLEFETGYILLRHRSRHHVRTICSICKEAFIGRDELQKHIILDHSENEWKFQCETCSKLFPTGEKLRFHKKSSHSQQQFECVEVDCKKTFRSRSGFNEHHKATHSPSVNICQQCGKIFNSLAYLNNHISKRHNDKVKEHRCAHCSAMFLEKKLVLRHIRQAHSNATKGVESVKPTR